ncbi:MAG: hypothetical protein B0D92_01820, partial [Spirochaeta sp. LUC14_002_19_P3]
MRLAHLVQATRIGLGVPLRVPLKTSFRKLTKKFFVDTRRQKRSVAGLREHFDNAVAAEKF